MATKSVHPVNQALIDDAPLGARFADAITGFMGSWKFIVVQTIIVAVWLVANIILLTRPFDPYPFILLNLAFSLQAGVRGATDPAGRQPGGDPGSDDPRTCGQRGRHEEKQNDRLLRGNTEILHGVATLEQRILALEQTILTTLKPDGS